MPTGRAWIAVIALALQAGAVPPALAAPRWLCAQSPHFELYSSSDRDSVVRLANALEDMADILGRAGLGRRTTARPVTVIIGFADKRSFEPHLPVHDGRRANFAGYVITIRSGTGSASPSSTSAGGWWRNTSTRTRS
jgi:hypothetical protein